MARADVVLGDHAHQGLVALEGTDHLAASVLVGGFLAEIDDQKAFYSVAQHCLVVAELVPAQYQLEALLHDATEAYVGDLVSPLKQALPEYRQIEMRVWHAICHRFDIDPVLPPCIHDADLIALATEKRDLMADHPDAWPCLTGTNPAAFRIKPMTQAEACQAYFNRLMELLATTHRARAAA